MAKQDKTQILAASTDMEPVAGTVDVDVPADELWSFFDQAYLWPRWNRCFFRVRNRHLELGKRLVWAFQPIRWYYLYKMFAVANIVELEPGRKVTWEVTAMPGFYARHTYSVEDLGNGRSRFGSWEKAYGWSFRLFKRFWIAHFTFVKDLSLEGARRLEAIHTRHGRLAHELLDAPAERPPASAAGKPGLSFTETMRGAVGLGETEDYAAGLRRGEAEGSPCEFTVTIATDDVDALLTDREHAARITGTVTAPKLGAGALQVTAGEFNLLVADPDRPGGRLMKYRMKLAGEDGRRFYLEGFKRVADDPGIDVWTDTTTLFVTLREGDSATGPVLGKGILKILLRDFARQLTTIKVTNAANVAQRLAKTAAFGKFFAGELFDVYGGVFAKPRVFNREAPPRQRRELAVEPPEVHFFRTGDGVDLRLLRYRGGDKGPVMLSHGLGVSSRIFSIDTIDTNLLEYLFGHGYDVWLLDYRASTDLAESRKQSTADEVATQDYPAAVAEVRRLSGAADIQAVVHCYGATTFFMAMLAGLEGVRSAAVSQIATHVVAPTTLKLKTGLHAPSFLKALGIDSLDAYVDDRSPWFEKLYDRALALQWFQPEERCTSATCHRITFMYSLLYEHDQLNTATHEALHELFGVASIDSLKHLALMVREGKVVDARGRDVYLPHLERLALPITFIHGAENACYLPESTEITYNLLREKNDPDLYVRHVIPNYGHIDCIFGKNAARDVYPHILDHLERTL